MLERGPDIRPLTIGQVAREAGVGVETVRFYERRGLLREPPRRPSGYRSYPQDAVKVLRFIRNAKDLGFSLKEIRDLMALRLRPGSSCPDVKRAATVKVVDIETRIRALQRIRRVLLRLVGACPTDASDSCPVLAALDAEPESKPGSQRGGKRRSRPS